MLDQIKRRIVPPNHQPDARDRSGGTRHPVDGAVTVVKPRALAPALAAYRPPDSPFAASLRDHGVATFVGAITQFNETPGQGTTTIGVMSPELAAAVGTSGGQQVTLNVDPEMARYLPPRTRVRVTLEVLPDE